MRITKTKKIDGCLEGTNVRDLQLDSALTKGFILYLGGFGKLIYNENMEKPFFTLIVKGKYTLKGAQGNRTIRAILPDNSEISTLDDFAEFIINYSK